MAAAVLPIDAAPPEEEEPLILLEPPSELLAGNHGQAEWGAVPIFFPPEPPPLERTAAGFSTGSWTRDRHLRPPPELNGFTGESFYPALGTLLVMHDLSRSGRRRIEEYRETKQRLQIELRAELLRVRDLSVDARRERLTAFAREQTPRVTELEETAEQLRASFIKIDYRWGEYRIEYLGYNSHRPESADAIADVMRAASYYEGGLLPAQRHFLREIAIELPLAANTVEEAMAKQPYLFFSPSLARVRLPDDLPEGVARKIADYERQRTALKKELYDLVFEADRRWLSIVRAVEFQVNLGPQAQTLARLERLAEDIRCDLAQRPAPAPARRWEIPRNVIERIDGMLAGQRALRASSTAAIETIRRREPTLEIGYAVEAGGVEFEVQLRPRFLLGRNADERQHAKVIEREMAAIAAAHREALAGFARERSAVRAALARALSLSETPEIDAALALAVREAFEQESDGPYRAYRAAVFEPGLSPEQRRLLFDSAVEQLGLPLPSGEYQPQN